jgi:hypothetical protein
MFPLRAAAGSRRPGPGCVEETIHRLFVDGVSACDAQAYFMFLFDASAVRTSSPPTARDEV